MSVGLKAFLVASSREGLDSTGLGSEAMPAVSGSPHAHTVSRLLQCLDQLDVVPAVVILDVPFDPAGLDIVRTIREHPVLRRTPLAALAANADQPLITRMYDAGVNSVIPRPGEVEELREVLDRVIDYWLNANYVSVD